MRLLLTILTVLATTTTAAVNAAQVAPGGGVAARGTAAPSCAELMAGLNAPAASVAPRARRDRTFSVVTVAYGAKDTGYIVDFGDGTPLQIIDVPTILRELRTVTAQRAQPVYVDLSALPEARRRAFDASAEVATARDGLHWVRDLTLLFDDVTSARTFAELDAGTVRAGAYKGQSYTRAELSVGGKKYGFTVISKLAAAALRFMARVKEVFTARVRESESTLAIVTRIRAEVAREFHMRDDEIVVQFTNQLGESQFVEVRNAVTRAARVGP